MIWLIFPKIRETFKIPKLFTVFKDDDNGRMFKFMTCSIILLLTALFGLGCAALTTKITPGAGDVVKGVANQATAPPASSVVK